MRLASPKGDFALPDPPPSKVLFISAGSGITPLIAMLRTLKVRGQSPDVVHLHSAPSQDATLFQDELQKRQEEDGNYRLHLQETATDGHVDFEQLDQLVPDWKDRQTWACGPTKAAKAAP